MWRKANPHSLLVGMQISEATVETSKGFPQKLKIKLPYNSVIPFLGIYPKKAETLIQKNIGTPMFIAALFTIAKIWRQAECPSVDEWNIYTMGYYSAIKKEILSFMTGWMDLESIMLIETSQSEKGSTIQFHLYVESNEQNKLTKQRQRHGYMEQTDSCQGGGGWRAQ